MSVIELLGYAVCFLIGWFVGYPQGKRLAHWVRSRRTR